MRKIPIALRKEIAADPFYKRCCITGTTYEKIDWHHNFIYAGKQINEKWAILPLAHSIHERVHEPDIKEQCDWIMLNRATDTQLAPYCKAIDYIKRRTVLNSLYGRYRY